MTNPVPDEMIMAFADGELASPLADRVRDALRADPAARRKYDAFNEVRTILAGTYGTILEEPVPDRLRRAILATAPRVHPPR